MFVGVGAAVEFVFLSISACSKDVTNCVRVWLQPFSLWQCVKTDLELLELALYVLNVFVSAASIQDHICIFITDLQVILY